MSESPWTFKEARDAAARASRAQEHAERALVDAAEAHAEAERRYRQALAEEIVRQHAQEGVAWSTAPDLARGNERVAKLRYERDVAEGVKEATTHAAWRAAADRRTTEALMTWSMRRELAENGGGSPSAGDQDDVPVIGARRAA